MRRRNGADALGWTTLIAGIALYVISLFVPYTGLKTAFTYIGLIAVIYTIFRIFSRNTYAREMENRRFVEFFKNRRSGRGSENKDYKILVCRGCGRKIRVPRKKGKIEVTCPICGDKSIHRT